MLAVIGALLIKAQGAHGGAHELRFRPALACTDPASAGEEMRVSPCDGDTGYETRALDPTMLPWIGAGDPDPHGRQGWTSLLGADLWRASETTEARSVVALSRVPR